MSDTYDPDERFSIWPLSGEEALKKALGGDDENEVTDDPEDDEEES